MERPQIYLGHTIWWRLTFSLVTDGIGDGAEQVADPMILSSRPQFVHGYVAGKNQANLLAGFPLNWGYP